MNRQKRHRVVTAAVVLASLTPVTITSSRAFGEQPAGATVFVATDSNYADAMTAGIPAAMQGAPLLTVARDQIPDVVRTDLLQRKPGRIVVVGGESAISAVVFDQLQQLTVPTGGAVRIAGRDRYETATLVAREVPAAAANAARLGGKAASEFLDRNTQAIDSRLLEGLPAAVFRKIWPRTVEVNRHGGASENGEALVETLRQIANDATATLVLLPPGLFDLGTRTLTLPANVSIVGVGAGLTTIAYSGTGTVLSAQNVGLHRLTVRGVLTVAKDASLLLEDVELSGVIESLKSAPGSLITMVDSRATGTVAIGGTGVVDRSTIDTTSTSTGVALRVDGFGRVEVNHSVVRASVTALQANKGGQLSVFYTRAQGATALAGEGSITVEFGSLTGATSGGPKCAASTINGTFVANGCQITGTPVGG